MSVAILCIALSMVAGVIHAKEWDYLVYTEEWPGTFCKYINCSFPANVVTGWNIHGLWPSNSQGKKDPTFCTPAPPFDFNALQSIFEILKVQWADLKSFGDPKKFWEHEWKKHGTCAIEDVNMPKEIDYFTAALRMKVNTKVDQTFRAAGIVPSDSNLYNESTIVDIIKRSLNITPVLRCIEYEGQFYLSAIEICTDKNFNLQNCYTTERSDLEIAQQFVKDVFTMVHQSLTGQNQRTPYNQQCLNRPFTLPLITQN